MDKLIITGQTRLSGSVTVSGAKNAVVAMIPATLLVNGISRIENVPHVSDVEKIINIIKNLGAKVTWEDNLLEIDASNISGYTANYDLVKKMRGSYYLLGALLGRFGKAQVALPGGCDFGTRPIDQHMKGFRAMGARVDIHHGLVDCESQGLTGAHIYLDVVTVGATINVMLAATRAAGVTIIENAAKEPHVVDVANFLNAMGAKIKGAGTDVIRILGVDKLCGGTYCPIPDQIEAGTFMLAAAAVGDDVLIKNVIPKHMDSLTAKLLEIGVEVMEYDDSIRVKNTRRARCTNVKTLPYPGFPTDLQPQMVVLLSMAEGISMVTESVWDNRFQYVDELKRMGASIRVEGRTAVIEGIPSLSGSPVKATDLRAGAGLVIAALAAEGTTEISDVYHIDRGYEFIEDKLKGLGAKIERVHVSGDNI